jgi:hypothetical protein
MVIRSPGKNKDCAILIPDGLWQFRKLIGNGNKAVERERG